MQLIIYKAVKTCVIGKLKFVSSSLFLDTPSFDPRCPLDSKFSLLTYTTRKKSEMPWVCLQFVIVVFPGHTHLV